MAGDASPATADDAAPAGTAAVDRVAFLVWDVRTGGSHRSRQPLESSLSVN